MTLKACRLIRQADRIAVPVLHPGDAPETSVAYQIAASAVPEMEGKPVLALAMPMETDAERLEMMHEAAADVLKARLKEGEEIVYLTLGDPTIYCSFAYLKERLVQDGFRTQYISAVPSFCAAAASLNTELALGKEELRVLPSHGEAAKEERNAFGVSSQQEQSVNKKRAVSYVCMKAGRHAGELRDHYAQAGCQVGAVERCGMEGERIFRYADQIPDRTAYFTVLLARSMKHTDRFN
jgi:precorrin-2/cobalt-factor-2 C20-methyltransferase